VPVLAPNAQMAVVMNVQTQIAMTKAAPTARRNRTPTKPTTCAHDWLP